MSKMNAMKTKLEDLQKEIKEKGEEAVKEMFKDFFDACPTVMAVRWNQYTPYFNDGEACHFSVNDFNYGFDLNDENNLPKSKYGPEDESTITTMGAEREIGFYDYFEDEKINTTELEAGVVNEIFELVFGDHSRITVTREKIEVDEYDHD